MMNNRSSKPTPTRIINRLSSLIILLGVSTTAYSQTTSPDTDSLESSRSTLQFTFTPGILLGRATGNSKLEPVAPPPVPAEQAADNSVFGAIGPVGGTSLDFEDDLGFDSSQSSFNGELLIQSGNDFSLRISGFAFSDDANMSVVSAATFGPLTLAAGDPIHTEYDMETFAVELIVPIWSPLVNSSTVQLEVNPVIGWRYVDVDLELNQIGIGRVSTGGEWAVLFVGAEVNFNFFPTDTFTPLNWLHMLQINAGVSAGPAFGGDGGSMTQVRGGITAHFTEHFGVEIGFRLVELDVENDEYELDGGLQGLFIGGSWRF